jgi:3-hydroxyisobutyrate dehydrogenase
VVRATPSIADAVHDAEVAGLSVRDEPQMLCVLFEPGGVAQGATNGSVVILTSTVGPGAAITAADQLARRGIRLVDAPVSGVAYRAVS